MASTPMKHKGMNRRDHAGEPHGEEEVSPEIAVTRRGERRRKKGDDDKNAQDWNGGEVEKAGVGIAREGVVDGGEEGGDDHDWDAGVVEAPKEEVEALGVGEEEVGDGAAD